MRTRSLFPRRVTIVSSFNVRRACIFYLSNLICMYTHTHTIRILMVISLPCLTVTSQSGGTMLCSLLGRRRVMMVLWVALAQRLSLPPNQTQQPQPTYKQTKKINDNVSVTSSFACNKASHSLDTAAAESNTLSTLYYK